jgi:hypothetical protein
MKKHTLILVIPLALVLKFSISKNWYIDDYDRIIFGVGFPFLNCIDAPTSVNFNKIFIIETIVNYLIFFVFSFIFVYMVNRFWLTIDFAKRTRFVLNILSSIFIIIYFTFNIFIFSIFGVEYIIKRPSSVKIIDSKMEYIWKK